MISFRCPGCQLVLQVLPEQAGSKLPCPHCQQRLQVPDRPPVNKTVLGEWAGDTALTVAPNLPASPMSAPAPVGRSWYYLRDNEKVGPVSEEALGRLARDRDIRPEDMVWSPGMGDWSPAHRYFEFPSRRARETTRWRRRRAEYDDDDDDYRDDYDDRDLDLRREGSGNNQVCGILSCIFGGVAFILCPPIFGLAGLILGIVAVTQERNKTLGTIGIVLSAAGAVGGMFIGAMLNFGLRGPW